jgi:hypothetical protein
MTWQQKSGAELSILLSHNCILCRFVELFLVKVAVFISAIMQNVIYTEHLTLDIAMLGVVLLNAIMLSVIVMNVIMLNIFKLNVIVLSAVMV